MRGLESQIGLVPSLADPGFQDCGKISAAVLT